MLSDPVPPAAARSLVMIAKCLQNLANLVEFGGKEPYMEVVNPFILKNKERMVVFLDHLSSVRDKPYPDEDRVKVSIKSTILKMCTFLLEDYSLGGYFEMSLSYI